MANFLARRAPLTAQAAAGETRFVDAVHLAIDTIMPNDVLSWDTIGELVPQEPAGAGALGCGLGHAGCVLGAPAVGG